MPSASPGHGEWSQGTSFPGGMLIHTHPPLTQPAIPPGWSRPSAHRWVTHMENANIDSVFLNISLPYTGNKRQNPADLRLTAKTSASPCNSSLHPMKKKSAKTRNMV